MTARQILDAQISEKAFQAQVIALAHQCNWLVYHTFDSRRSAPGFPDLVMAHTTDHSKPLVIAELKTETGRLSKHQKAWLAALKAFDHSDEVVVRVWRPSNWPEIELLLTKGVIA